MSPSKLGGQATPVLIRRGGSAATATGASLGPQPRAGAGGAGMHMQ